MPTAARHIALTLALLCAGCATRPPASDPEARQAYDAANDPWEPTNRFCFQVNEVTDRYAVAPIARAYTQAVPSPLRAGLHHFLENLESPTLLVNDVAQGKPRRAGDTFMRFLINSTLGLAGIFDVATSLGYPRHTTGFNITLALWGVPSGSYYFVPLFGPGSDRGFAGFLLDAASNPLLYVPRNLGLRTFEQAQYGTSLLDARSRHLQDIAAIRDTALDPYATFRSLYRQSVAAEIAETRADRRTTVPDWYTR